MCLFINNPRLKKRAFHFNEAKIIGNYQRKQCLREIFIHSKAKKLINRLEAYKNSPSVSGRLLRLSIKRAHSASYPTGGRHIVSPTLRVQSSDASMIIKENGADLHRCCINRLPLDVVDGPYLRFLTSLIRPLAIKTFVSSNGMRYSSFSSLPFWILRFFIIRSNKSLAYWHLRSFLIL